MTPWSRSPSAALRRVIGVATDLDGTLTGDDGRLPAAAYRALWAARDAGLLVAVATGRSAGWCHAIASQWPVDVVVGEGGGLYFANTPRGVRRRYAIADPARRRAARARLLAIGDAAGARWASDNAFREHDVAADWNEEERLTPEARDRLLAAFRRAGASASHSSVHVNAWPGRAGKVAMLRRWSREVRGVTIETDRWVYVGDAPNDAEAFGAFRLSVGVATVRRQLASLDAPPAFVTRGGGGAGFAQVVFRLLAVRR